MLYNNKISSSNLSSNSTGLPQTSSFSEQQMIDLVNAAVSARESKIIEQQNELRKLKTAEEKRIVRNF